MTKFTSEQKVLHNGIEKTIKVARKNFSNGVIIYKLDTGEEVEEDDLKPVKGKMTRTKKPTKKEQAKKEQAKLDKLLKERLEVISEYQSIFEADEDFNQADLNEVLIKLSDEDFQKFYDGLVEKAIAIEDNENDTED